MSKMTAEWCALTRRVAQTRMRDRSKVKMELDYGEFFDLLDDADELREWEKPMGLWITTAGDEVTEIGLTDQDGDPIDCELADDVVVTRLRDLQARTAELEAAARLVMLQARGKVRREHLDKLAALLGEGGDDV